jgi:hypothetical protein
MFMNDYEIHSAQQRYGAQSGQPNLGKATDNLAALADWANANSDGWAYWPKPRRAAKRLQELIQAADKASRDYSTDGTADITAADLTKALAPIKAFLTRQGVDHSTVLL